jgi:hypothetical protein
MTAYYDPNRHRIPKQRQGSQPGLGSHGKNMKNAKDYADKHGRGSKAGRGSFGDVPLMGSGDDKGGCGGLILVFAILFIVGMIMGASLHYAV